jgi:hypothetical protein
MAYRDFGRHTDQRFGNINMAKQFQQVGDVDEPAPLLPNWPVIEPEDVDEDELAAEVRSHDSKTSCICFCTTVT